ncbi:uncharacterized protein DUF1801 [Microterricola gilva]|uniref:Uncharacterized protein DUF1801 n=1 Tax=Microterricola gilva TaxID=393267 RepID=A0A4Q8AP65_9MICO|nr:DUF1801 domain-containing protein [Microterricola gilva]RZU65853.1 uncharacterized protein DUF1801 [Microterricola gilva]
MSRAEVEHYLSALRHPLADVLAELCALIRASDPRIDETIKWNAPSFFISDHFATTGVAPTGGIRLVLHTGAKKRAAALVITIDGADGLLDWKGTDRAVVSFDSREQFDGCRERLSAVLAQWIAQTQSQE